MANILKLYYKLACSPREKKENEKISQNISSFTHGSSKCVTWVLKTTHKMLKY